MTLKQPDRHDPSLEVALHDYLGNFQYHVVVDLGHSYSTQFKEFTEWCDQRLGVKYKDWIIVGGGTKGSKSTLHIKDKKWIAFMMLTFPHLIDHSFDIN